MAANAGVLNEDEYEHRVQRLYALGSNGSGQLGIGHAEDVSRPTPVLGVSTAPIMDVTCGGNHAVILYRNGRLATSGDNTDGRCMTKSKSITVELAHVAIPPDEPGGTEVSIEHIATTWSSTTAVSMKGQLLVCGTGTSGELGLGHGTETTPAPVIIKDFPPLGTRIVKIASCMAHTVVVLSNGEVWGWGKGRQGQLGSPAGHRWQPSRIEGIPFLAVNAVCGKDFTCVLGHPSTGELLMLGPNGKDRFGVKANAPTSVPGWKQVAASWGSVFVLLQSGKLVGWGRDDRGQLPPRHLPSLKSIAAGSEHCIGLSTHESKVLAWGWSEHGNCGPRTDANGNVKGRWNELQTPLPATALFAGCATSFVVTQDGISPSG